MAFPKQSAPPCPPMPSARFCHLITVALTVEDSGLFGDKLLISKFFGLQGSLCEYPPTPRILPYGPHRLASPLSPELEVTTAAIAS